MRRHWAIAALAALLVAVGLVSGCVSSDDEEARTPTGAETITNTAVQTDDSGATVPAPGAEEPAAPGTEPGEATDGAPADPGEGAAAGDAAAGESFFAQSCSGCHMDGGRAAGGIGPQLAGAGLSAEQVEDVVVNGRGAMPGGLASGDDLDNVVAYVVGLQ